VKDIQPFQREMVLSLNGNYIFNLSVYLYIPLRRRWKLSSKVTWSSSK